LVNSFLTGAFSQGTSVTGTSGISYTITYNGAKTDPDGTGEYVLLTSVPEPASCLLAGIGMMGLLARRRRNRHIR
jgi:hypothetical protein